MTLTEVVECRVAAQAPPAKEVLQRVRGDFSYPGVETGGIPNRADLSDGRQEHFLDEIVTVLVGPKHGLDAAPNSSRIARVNDLGLNRGGGSPRGGLPWASVRPMHRKQAHCLSSGAGVAFPSSGCSVNFRAFTLQPAVQESRTLNGRALKRHKR
jgi:hypothetical protein